MSHKNFPGFPPPSFRDVRVPIIAAEVPTLEFDGHRFEIGPGLAAAIPIIYLAYRARRGDAEADSVLKSFGVNLKDVNGKLYYPAPVVHPEQSPVIEVVDPASAAKVRLIPEG